MTYTLSLVPRGTPYTNITGTGDIVVKVRSVVRNEHGVITAKYGAVLKTNDIYEAPVFVSNVVKNWDGPGELECTIFNNGDQDLSSITWHSI